MPLVISLSWTISGKYFSVFKGLLYTYANDWLLPKTTFDIDLTGNKG